MTESKKILNKYLYARGTISKDSLIAAFKRGGLDLTQENINWLESDAGKRKAVEDYEELISHNDAKAKADKANDLYDQAQKIFLP